MTTHWGDQNPFGLGLSDVGQMDPGRDDALSVLQRVRDGLRDKPAESSSEEGGQTA